MHLYLIYFVTILNCNAIFKYEPLIISICLYLFIPMGRSNKLYIQLWNSDFQRWDNITSQKHQWSQQIVNKYMYIFIIAWLSIKYNVPETLYIYIYMYIIINAIVDCCYCPTVSEIKEVLLLWLESLFEMPVFKNLDLGGMMIFSLPSAPPPAQVWSWYDLFPREHEESFVEEDQSADLL